MTTSDDDPNLSKEAAREMIEREAQQWLVLLTSGRATAADAEAAKRWCGQSIAHAQAFAEANLLWDNLGPAAQRVPASIGLLHANSNRRPSIARRAFLGGAAAASIAAIGYMVVRPPLELWPSVSELAADYRTKTGERRQIAIEDGVSIDLNTRSSLNVRSTDKAARIELVSGEAAVSTSQKLSAPLSIAAAGGVVHTMDAQFNLRCDGPWVTVTCHRGAVSVDYAGQSTVLHEGRQVSYANGALDPEMTVDPAVIMAWRDGQLIFRQTPLSQVIEEINRYRSGRVILMNQTLGHRLVEARVPVDRVDDLIVLVQKAYGARVTALPGGVVVLS